MVVDGADYLRQRITDVVDSALRELEGASSSRWVAIIESTAPDGERACWLLNSPGAKPWDTLGLLRFAESAESVSLDDDEDE